MALVTVVLRCSGVAVTCLVVALVALGCCLAVAPVAPRLAGFGILRLHLYRAWWWRPPGSLLVGAFHSTALSSSRSNSFATWPFQHHSHMVRCGGSLVEAPCGNTTSSLLQASPFARCHCPSCSHTFAPAGSHSVGMSCSKTSSSCPTNLFATGPHQLGNQSGPSLPPQLPRQPGNPPCDSCSTTNDVKETTAPNLTSNPNGNRGSCVRSTSSSCPLATQSASCLDPSGNHTSRCSHVSRTGSTTASSPHSRRSPTESSPTRNQTRSGQHQGRLTRLRTHELPGTATPQA